jgi:hypothetical protein
MILWLRVNGIVPLRWSKAKETRIMTEQNRLMEIRRELEKNIYRKPDSKGFSYAWSVLILAILVASWGGWMWMAIHYYHRIASLEKQLSAYQEQQRVRDNPPDGLETWHALKVTSRDGRNSFHALTLNPSTHEWANAFYQVCNKPDGTEFDLDHEIQPGVTIIGITWRVDRINACKDMNSRFAGSNLWREPNGRLILASYESEP